MKRIPFLIALFVIVSAERNPKDNCLERLSGCGISCETKSCQSRFSWCVRDSICGKTCISKGHVCNDPEEIENGRIIGYYRRWYGAKITYSCEDDFELIGSRDRICMGNKQWSGETPHCVKKGIRCPEPSFGVTNGYADINDERKEFYIGEKAVYKCHIGFAPVSSTNTETTCEYTSDGSAAWTPEIELKCQEKTCNEPESIPNGAYVKSSRYHVGHRINYSCNRGYVLQGTGMRTCSDNQEWSGILPSCADTSKSCPRPERITHGYYLGDSFYAGDRLHYRCYPGYVLKGNVERICTEKQVWSSPAPICEDQISRYTSKIRVVLSSKNSAMITWTPPTDIGDSIDEYIIYRNDSWNKYPVKYTVPSDVLQVEVKELPKDSEYDFWIKAKFKNNEKQITPIAHYKHVINGDNVPAEIVSFGKKIPSEKGESLILRCSAVGNPKPQRTWFKNNQPVSKSSRVRVLSNGELYIGHFMKGDEGNYKCQVQNPYGKGEILYEIIFQDFEPISTTSTTTNPTLNCENYSKNDYDDYYDSQLEVNGKGSNSDCCLDRIENAVVSLNSQPLADSTLFIADGSLIKIRCNNITSFKMEGENSLQCTNGRWNSKPPICIKLNIRDRSGPPVIDYEVFNGNFKIDDDGSLNVREGSTLTLKCLWLENYGQAKWTLKTGGQVPFVKPAIWNALKNSFDLVVSPVKSFHATNYRCCVSNKQCNRIIIKVSPEPGTTPSPTSDPIIPDLLPPDSVTCKPLSTRNIQVEWEYHSQMPENASPQGYKIIYWDGVGSFDEDQKSVKVPSVSDTVLHSLDEDTFYMIEVLGFSRNGDGIQSEPVYCKTKSSTEIPPTRNKCRFYKHKQVRALINGREIIGPYADISNYDMVQSRCLQNNFKFYGSNKLKCVNGVWDGTIPYCIKLKERDRFNPPSIRYELIRSNGFIGDDGFIYVEKGGSLKLNCLWDQSNGMLKWEINAKTKTMPTWNSQKNSYDLYLTSINANHEGEYRCCTPYKKCNTYYIKIDADPTPVPIPVIPTCSLPPMLNNGIITGERDEDNKGYVKVTYECKEGYALDGNAERVCLQNDEWSGNDPTCIVNECAIRDPPDHGYLKYLSGFLLNDRVKDACHDGYYLNGKETATCIFKNGRLQWSSPTPLCIPDGMVPPSTTETSVRKCGLIHPGYLKATVDGIEVDVQNYNFPDKSTVKFRCIDITSYIFNGDRVLKCEAGEWNGTEPICTKLTIRSKTGPPVFEYESDGSYVDENGYLNIEKDTSLKLGCAWYQRNGVPTWKTTPSDVQFSTKWNAEKNNYEITPKQLLSGKTIKFTCCTPQRKCNSIRVNFLPMDPSHSSEEEDMTCEMPKDPANGFVRVLTNLLINGKIFYGCNENFELKGSKRAECVLRNGKLQWSSPQPECVEMIPSGSCKLTNSQHLIAVVNGKEVNPLIYNFYDKVTVKLRCEELTEYKFEGDNILKCENGEWNGTAPRCSKLISRNRHSPPTIEYEVENGETEIDDDGSLIVSAGSDLKLSCLWFASYGTIGWKAESRSGPIERLNPEWNERNDSYDLYLKPCLTSRDITYTCVTLYKRENSVRVKVKSHR